MCWTLPGDWSGLVARQWIAILPGAIVGTAIVNVISGIVMWLESSRFGEDTLFERIIQSIVSWKGKNG